MSAALLLPAIPVALIALVLLSQSRTWATDRATDQASRSAALISSTVVAPALSDDDFTGGTPTPARISELDDALLPLIGDQIVRLRVWNADGTVVYSDLGDSIGERFAISHDLEEALAGDIHSGVSSLTKDENRAERDFGKLLEVYVPFGGEDQPIGAVEFYMGYEPIEAAIRADFRQVGLLVLIMIGLIYLALVKFAVSAVRDRRRADAKAIEASQDPLTGIANRRAFDEALTLGFADGEDPLVAVLILDIDDFKDINDTAGHATGDAVLRSLAERLTRLVREDTVVARLGGDEFGVVLNGASSHQVDGIAQRLIEGLNEPLDVPGSDVALRVSIGSAANSGNAAGPEALVDMADAALYVAKRSGKNRHVAFTRGMREPSPAVVHDSV